MHSEALSSDELLALATPSQGPPDAERRIQVADADASPQPALLDLHRHFASGLAAELSALINREVSVQLRDQAVSTYSQFVFGQSVPTCCAIAYAEPINLEFYLATEPRIVYPLMDRMLGSKQPEPIPHRPPTEIELGLASLLLSAVLTKYGAAWQFALSFKLHVDRIEYNLQQLRALAGSEQTYRARYDIRCGRDVGHLEICLPWKATQQLRTRLSATDT